VRAGGRRLAGGFLELAAGALAAMSASPGTGSDGIPAEPRSILVLRNNDLGDLLVVTPLFEALRRRFPEARLTAAVGSWSAGILRGNPYLSEVVATDAPWFNKFVRPQGALPALRYLAASPQVSALRRGGYEVGIDVLGSVWGALLLLRAGIPCRLGVRGYAGGHRALQRWVEFDSWEHVGRRALRFAELLGATELPPCRPQLFLDAAERAAGEAAWNGMGGRRRVAIAPGGGLAVKCWPPDHWEALAGRLAQQGDAVAVLGGPRERGLGERITGIAPGGRSGRNVAGQLSLRESFAALAAADLVVCNSSVWMHAAAAFSRPTFVLLGESFPSARQHDAQWGYPGTCWSLGREAGGRTALYSPEEALSRIREEGRR
jgi:heptosyltransferase-2